MSKENGVAEVEKVQIVNVNFDKSDEAVLQLNLDKGFVLEWSHESFRKLPEKVWKQLKPENMRNYLKAEGIFEAVYRVNNAERVEVVDNPFNPIEGNADYRLKIRERKGWHGAWKAPGIELDSALLGPYVQVRKPKEGTKEQPGEETGEVLKILDSEGKVEAVAVECREDAIKKYKEWMSQQSRKRYDGIKSEFAAGVSSINRGLSKSEGRITPLDENGKPLG